MSVRNSGVPSRKRPKIYPALLSRVAEAFQERIALSDRIKDGLTYKDVFDGREAVDKISYIINTTDRNLALLLGRALDAQKFFHDVTYDHRLRDSASELYQFRSKLPSPFVSGDLPNEGNHTHGDQLSQHEKLLQALQVKSHLRMVVSCRDPFLGRPRLPSITSRPAGNSRSRRGPPSLRRLHSSD